MCLTRSLRYATERRIKRMYSAISTTLVRIRFLCKRIISLVSRLFLNLFRSILSAPTFKSGFKFTSATCNLNPRALRFFGFPRRSPSEVFALWSFVVDSVLISSLSHHHHYYHGLAFLAYFWTRISLKLPPNFPSGSFRDSLILFSIFLFFSFPYDSMLAHSPESVPNFLPISQISEGVPQFSDSFFLDFCIVSWDGPIFQSSLSELSSRFHPYNFSVFQSHRSIVIPFTLPSCSPQWCSRTSIPHQSVVIVDSGSGHFWFAWNSTSPLFN